VYYVCVCGFEWVVKDPPYNTTTGYPDPIQCPDSLLDDAGNKPEGCGQEALPDHAVCAVCGAVTNFT
jgi:hypothetical protein